MLRLSRTTQIIRSPLSLNVFEGIQCLSTQTNDESLTVDFKLDLAIYFRACASAWTAVVLILHRTPLDDFHCYLRSLL